jgi:MoaA/NifB/PqqE/SkfB family radical SAM enzyme
MKRSIKSLQLEHIKHGIYHCTLNPNENDSVRIHLIPPKFKLFRNESYIVIINGYYLIPIGSSWAAILACYIDEMHTFEGRSITEDDQHNIVDRVSDKICQIFRYVNKATVADHLGLIINVIFDIAYGKDPQIVIEKMSIREYSSNMSAPHRMDLMVSAMTDLNGCWKCNQKCIFCYAGDQKLSSSKELSTDEWKIIIDKLSKANIPMLTFTGGEPTLRSDLVELITYSKNFVTRLNTNGVKLTKELVNKLKIAELDSIQITLYSSDENIHNELVGANNYQMTVLGIKNAVDAGLSISINTPLCKLNANYAKTLEFIYSLGISFVTVSGIICTGAAKENHSKYDLDEKLLFEIVKNAKEFCDSNGMEIDFTSPGLIRPELLESINMNVPICGASLSNMAITPNGTVVPCQSWLSQDGASGNILNDSFSKIWNHKICKKLRHMSDLDAIECPFRNNGEKRNNGKIPKTY